MSKRAGDKFQCPELSPDEYQAATTAAGVTVLNVYAKWCGPCMAVIPAETATRMELLEDKNMVKFYNACADDIAELELYRGKCRPCMMVFAGGNLVDVVRGVNGPLIAARIKHHVAYEKRVLEDLEERVVFIDKAVGSRPCSGESVNVVNESTEECLWIETTAALIKPDGVEAGLVDEIKKRIIEGGFEIVAEESVKLSEEQVRTLYSEHESKDFFPDLSASMVNKDVVVMALRGDKAIGRWRDLLGHTYPETAKQQNARSIRALYGTSNVKNTAHGSYSELLARKELKLLFGDAKGEEYAHYEKIVKERTPSAKRNKSEPASAEEAEAGPPQEAPASESEPAPKEYTVALIKPDASEHADEILSRIKEDGFEILLEKKETWETAKVEEFYAEHKERDFYATLVEYMSGGPVVALLLHKDGAIQQWRTLQGPQDRSEAEANPECLRAKYGTDGTRNGFHGSDSPESALREATFVFGADEVEAATAPAPAPAAATTEPEAADAAAPEPDAGGAEGEAPPTEDPPVNGTEAADAAAAANDAPTEEASAAAEDSAPAPAAAEEPTTDGTATEAEAAPAPAEEAPAPAEEAAPEAEPAEAPQE